MGHINEGGKTVHKTEMNIIFTVITEDTCVTQPFQNFCLDNYPFKNLKKCMKDSNPFSLKNSLPTKLFLD